MASTPSAAGKSTCTPQFPAKAISSRATAAPPSDISCPATIMSPSSSSSIVLRAFLSTATSSMSGHWSPIWEKACASADPPVRRLPCAMSTCTTLLPAFLKSGVTFLVMSSMSQYAEITRDPGVLTTSPSALAAMESESLPPSIAMPTLIMISLIATAQSYINAPSPSIFAAHIQFPEALMLLRDVMRAKHMLVRASATLSRAIAPLSRNPLIGCSPILHAAPE
mmetsp:Transcript_37183/g.71307  ORF Transcript_37183/g.71307 Transcript_37183/m.71307 type:complete len:224 (+) Transcript_37183:1448-2119(+)